MKKQTYKHLNAHERERLYQFHNSGDSLRSIAKSLGRSAATISREIKRSLNHSVTRYHPDEAERLCANRKKKIRKGCYIDKDSVIKAYVLGRLSEGWSPEQIAGRMKTDTGKYLNKESIYQYIYKNSEEENQLCFFLRRRHRIRHKKYGRKPHKGRVPGRVDISERPKSIDTRQTFGHWEGDSMFFYGGRQVLATHTERKSRFFVALKVPSISAKIRTTIVSEYFQQFPKESRQTMTVDNGVEFDPVGLKIGTGMDIYFTKPYSAWQKGAIENQNGLLRWYLPRQKNLLALDPGQINRIVDLINTRPRKCLSFRNPKEVFYSELEKISKNPSTVALLN